MTTPDVQEPQAHQESPAQVAPGVSVTAPTTTHSQASDEVSLAPEPQAYYFTNPGQILDADDQVWGEVPVPEWAPKGHPHPERWILKLKGLSGKERDAFEASINQVRGKSQKQNYENFRARLIIMCAVDPDGHRLFSRADVKRLGDKSSKALARVFDKCNELSGLGEDDVEELTEAFGDGQS